MEWKQVGTDTECFVLEYQARGYARTNCCAFGTSQGYVIVSPASGIDETHIRFLENRAPLLALVPPHPGHTLGIGDWKKLRPQLPVYAASAALPRLKKVTGISVLPISMLRVDDPSVSIVLAPGMNETTVWLISRKGERPVAYVDELLEDLDRVPGSWLMKPMMLLFGKWPGFHVNRGFIRFFVQDKKRLADEVLKMIEQNAHLIFAHGPVRSDADDLARARQLVESV